MKLFLQSLSNTPIVSTPPVEEPTPTGEEIAYGLIAGQSNAAGRRTAGMPTMYTGPMTLNGHTAYIRNMALNPDTFEVLECYVNTSDSIGRVGCQPPLAYHLLEGLQKDVHLLQCGWGGKTILNWDNGKTYMEWIVSTASELATAAAAEGKAARFPYCLWIQGESDGGDTTGYYRDKLRSLASRLRSRLGEENMKFIIVQMSDCQTGVGNLAQLQATQEEVAQDANNFLISKASGPDVCKDTLHWAIEKYESVGQVAASIILS
jgi:hypothetical protein